MLPSKKISSEWIKKLLPDLGKLTLGITALILCLSLASIPITISIKILTDVIKFFWSWPISG